MVGIAPPARAGRPLITDDAGVVGVRTAQVESWLHVDETVWEHWIMAAIGPAAPLELALGGVWGLAEDGEDRALGAGGPVAQAKFLAREPTPGGWPGAAVAAGARAPSGPEAFAPPGWSGYGYLALTSSPFEADRVVVHLNAGVSVLDDDGAERQVGPTLGLASQFRLVGELQAVGEVFTADPHGDLAATAGQLGLVYGLSESFQIDATAGTGLSGDPRPGWWATIGIKLVSPPLW